MTRKTARSATGRVENRLEAATDLYDAVEVEEGQVVGWTQCEAEVQAACATQKQAPGSAKLLGSGREGVNAPSARVFLLSPPSARLSAWTSAESSWCGLTGKVRWLSR